MTTSDQLNARLDALLRELRVPGAVVALYADGQTHQATAGICNLATGVEVTEDTLFQIGSITKLFTATVVAGLSDDRQLQLDAPVANHIPAFKVRYPSVTLRHLLTHSSGLQGDFFADFGAGDECVERYATAVAEIEPLHAAGERYSYCNAGFTVAAHVIERATEEPWEGVLRSRLVGPAGLGSCVTLPEEAILRRVAVGHVLDPDDPGGGPIQRAPRWYFSRATGPAGAICATASDLLDFGRIVLNQGRAANGAEVLPAASVASMLAHDVSIPPYVGSGLRGVGLAWRIYDWQGSRALGHDGSTLGQFAFLRVFPDHDVVVALLTNGPDGKRLFRRLFEPLLAEQWGIRMPEDLSPTSDAEVGPAHYVGKYESLARVLRVEEDGSDLKISVEGTGPLASSSPPVVRERLQPIGENAFALSPLGLPAVSVVFTDFAEGRPGWLYARGRAHHRTA